MIGGYCSAFVVVVEMLYAECMCCKYALIMFLTLILKFHFGFFSSLIIQYYGSFFILWVIQYIDNTALDA